MNCNLAVGDQSVLTGSEGGGLEMQSRKTSPLPTATIHGRKALRHLQIWGRTLGPPYTFNHAEMELKFPKPIFESLVFLHEWPA